MDARRQRITISQLQASAIKWVCLYLQAVCALIAIALVHSDNRATASIAMGLFATAMAACVVLIASHNEPFTGEISVSPSLLLQVLPKE